MLFQVLCGLEPIFYTTHPNEEPEKNTIIISEDDETKCAHSENGMLMHFFEEEELRSLFCNLNEVKNDRITETHDNQKFCDCNYIVTAQK